MRGRDLALIASDMPASVAGVFTRSSVVGAPVEVTRARVRAGRARGVIVNSGVANVALGARGVRDAERMAEMAARALGCDAREFLVASTGVIGKPLPLARLRAGVPAAVRALRADGLRDAAHAIMTTDTRPKLASARVRIRGRDVSIVGIAKGSGMIEPQLATMLAFVLTDAALVPACARRFLRTAAEASFNRLSVDGETSTSDMLLLLANGAAGHAPLRDVTGRAAARFQSALTAVCAELARAVARDGEGATKLVTVRVCGARSRGEAERAARRIANSLLVKTALFGADPNWGRILQTVGAGRVAVDLTRAEVRLAGVAVYRRGRALGEAARLRARRRLARREIEIAVDLAAGRAEFWVWTCDLSYDYVRINAEYTS